MRKTETKKNENNLKNITSTDRKKSPEGKDTQAKGIKKRASTYKRDS